MTKKFSLLMVRMVTLVLLMTIVPHFASAVDPCIDDPAACDPDAPIDGGLSLLLAAGVGYGLKKVRDERKKRTANLN